MHVKRAAIGADECKKIYRSRPALSAIAIIMASKARHALLGYKIADNMATRRRLRSLVHALITDAAAVGIFVADLSATRLRPSFQDYERRLPASRIAPAKPVRF